MNIVDTIVKLKQDFHIECGKPPKNIYLGNTEYKSLMYSASYTASVHYSSEFYGMRLFHVRTENHIGVGV